MTARRRFRLTRADGLFALALAALVGGVVWCEHRPSCTETAGLRSRLADQRRVQRELDQVATTLEGIGASTDGLEVQLAGYERRMLGAASNSQYLETISGLQERCDVVVEQISPGKTRQEQQYEVRNVKVTAKGRFADVLCFVHELKVDLWSANLFDLRVRTEAGDVDCRVMLDLDLYVDPGSPATEATEKPIRPRAGA